jgi:hypothetical protein
LVGGLGKRAGMYDIESVRGFDFFPQTSHVEGVAFLKRVDKSEPVTSEVVKSEDVKSEVSVDAQPEGMVAEASSSGGEIEPAKIENES